MRNRLQAEQALAAHKERTRRERAQRIDGDLPRLIGPAVVTMADQQRMTLKEAMQLVRAYFPAVRAKYLELGTPYRDDDEAALRWLVAELLDWHT